MLSAPKLDSFTNRHKTQDDRTDNEGGVVAVLLSNETIKSEGFCPVKKNSFCCHANVHSSLKNYCKHAAVGKKKLKRILCCVECGVQSLWTLGRRRPYCAGLGEEISWEAGEMPSFPELCIFSVYLTPSQTLKLSCYLWWFHPSIFSQFIPMVVIFSSLLSFQATLSVISHPLFHTRSPSERLVIWTSP